MPLSSTHLKDHIEIIVKHEEEFMARRTASERLGDTLGSVIGSLRFVVLHVAWFTLWIVINLVSWSPIPRFDPYPFPLLDTIVALEAIFLASFIVMRQGRSSRRSEEREHLMLQVMILVEKEVTAILNLERQLAERAGIKEATVDSEIQELGEKTSIDEVAKTIREALPAE